MHTPEALDPEQLSADSPWGIPVLVVAETGSSNDDLLRLGESGAPEGTLLFAESQTAGRGRHRRSWASSPRLGLWFSLLLRLPVDDSTIPALSAFAAVALVETLRDYGVRDCGIKEPNDVLVRARKIAGILIETRPGPAAFAVVGIGLNVHHRASDFPEGIGGQAVSLAMVSGGVPDRQQVAGRLLARLRESHRLLVSDRGRLLASWKKMLLPSVREAPATP